MKTIVKKTYESIPFRPMLFKILRRLYRPPERVYRHLHFRARFELILPNQERILINHYGNHVENDLFWAGFGNGWEATSLRLWLLLAQRATVILDVGANTGVYSLVARAANNRASVIALEPIVRTFAWLQRNIELNGFDIQALCVAASDRDGTATIYDPVSEHQYSASLEADMLSGKAKLAKVEIDIKRIDTILADRELRAPVLVKIDAERHEPKVLEGFGGLIRQLRPVLLMELLDGNIGAKVKNYFEGLDYIYYEIHEGQCIRRTDQLGRAQRNYLLCPIEFADELKLEHTIPHCSLSPKST